MGFKWNPLTGNLDYYEPKEDGLSVSILQETLVASENISALKLIYRTSPTDGGLADYQDISKKDVIGLSLTTATIGNTFECLLFGKHEDAFFNYSINEILFLGNNGNITNVAPTTGYSVTIGKGFGTGSIFINIERPIIL